MRIYKYYRDNHLIAVLTIDNYATAEQFGQTIHADVVSDCSHNPTWDDFFNRVETDNP